MMWLPLLKKAGPYIAVVVAMGSVLGYTYNLGVQNERTRQQAALVDSANKGRKETERKIREALHIQAQEYEEQLEQAEAEREVIIRTEEVVKHVEKIVVDDSCKRFAVDVIWLLHEASTIPTTGGAEAPDP